MSVPYPHRLHPEGQALWWPDEMKGKGTCQAAPSWTTQASPPKPRPQILVGVTCTEEEPGFWLPQVGGLAAWGLHLAHSLLHSADVAVQPPGTAEFGQTVLLVRQQGALWSFQGTECLLQRSQC